MMRWSSWVILFLFCTVFTKLGYDQIVMLEMIITQVLAVKVFWELADVIDRMPGRHR